ncbi:MAG: hypothetical protein B7Z15_10965 [Rhizobiales bacterium 32-66-8]|nr:MAG: hypothetical protein B7Z15_10965 [Rhizobiales bacterium 32-66-8]
MIRFLFRFLGFWILAGGFVALVVDGTRSIAASSLVLTSARSAWASVAAGSLTQMQTQVAAIAPWAWSDLLGPALDIPLFAVLAVVGLVFLAVGRRKIRSRFDTNR